MRKAVCELEKAVVSPARAGLPVQSLALFLSGPLLTLSPHLLGGCRGGD